MILKFVKRMAVILIITLPGTFQPLAAGETRREIAGNTAETLINSRFYFSKDIRFCWEEAGGSVCNDINMNDAGSIYITEAGFVHRGNRVFLVRWQDIIRIAQPVGKPDVLSIRTVEPTEKLTLTDYKRTGSLTNLDTALDTLLRILQKNLKKFKDLPPTPLPEPMPQVQPPTQAPQLPPPVQTKPHTTIDIKEGLSPQQVEEKLGPPLKRILLKSKIIYQYSDMVITFIDGKLQDLTIK